MYDVVSRGALRKKKPYWEALLGGDCCLSTPYFHQGRVADVVPIITRSIGVCCIKYIYISHDNAIYL